MRLHNDTAFDKKVLRWRVVAPFLFECLVAGQSGTSTVNWASPEEMSGANSWALKRWPPRTANEDREQPWGVRSPTLL